ncbi:MAG: hypothetical protein EOO65_01575 [Methanosarcinales archaeon]|nr:MAG: hypothetical protein EOO65_01575 [Methanosarcinales archaeon]
MFIFVRLCQSRLQAATSSVPFEHAAEAEYELRVHADAPDEHHRYPAHAWHEAHRVRHLLLTELQRRAAAPGGGAPWPAPRFTREEWARCWECAAQSQMNGTLHSLDVPVVPAHYEVTDRAQYMLVAKGADPAQRPPTSTATLETAGGLAIWPEDMWVEKVFDFFWVANGWVSKKTIPKVCGAVRLHRRCRTAAALRPLAPHRSHRPHTPTAAGHIYNRYRLGSVETKAGRIHHSLWLSQVGVQAIERHVR